MATFEVLALITDTAHKHLAHNLATGKSYKVTSFTVGNQGHDPADPFNAKSPSSLTKIDKPVDETVFPPIAFGPGDVDESSGVLNPIFVCQLPANRGTGVVSSIYLYAEVVYDPTVVLPALRVLTGVPRFIDLGAGEIFNDGAHESRHVIENDLDYYWTGTMWLPVRERFLFAVGTMPQLIKLVGQDDTYRVYVQS